MSIILLVLLLILVSPLILVVGYYTLIAGATVAIVVGPWIYMYYIGGVVGLVVVGVFVGVGAGLNVWGNSIVRREGGRPVTKQDAVVFYNEQW